MRKYKERLEPAETAEILSAAMERKTIDVASEYSGILYDLNFIEKRLERIRNSFKAALNTTAIKANPFINLLKYVKKEGLGAEAASLPELFIAKAAGFRAEETVFDSPAKTMEEIAYAVSNRIYINADSFPELERIEQFLVSSGIKDYRAGLRINPQTGAGRILSTSVSGMYSKFGIPIEEKREAIVKAFSKYKWLKGLHLHTGSQGFGLEKLTEGVKKVYQLAEEINGKSGMVEIIDIGGGLPVSYLENDEDISVEDYAEQLKKEAPGLFDGKYRLITEFGRYLYNPAGFAWSSVEYVKKGIDADTLVIHLGADMFIRECYNPLDWKHEVLVTDKNGTLKTSENRRKYRIAGPLCFAGDFPVPKTELPEVDEGDIVLIRDSGSYTASMWSRYNSRQFPAVKGYDREKNIFITIKERETPEIAAGFWV